MAGISVNRVTNANIYLNGQNHLGKAEEVELPMIKQIMVQHKALGMIGSVEFFAGLDKMEAKIKWNSFYADTMKVAADPTKTVQLQVRASLETYDSGGRSAQKPLVAFLTAQYKDFPIGNFKQHDNVELTSMLSVTAIRLEIDGEEIISVDVLANVYKVAGTDALATYRANLGI